MELLGIIISIVGVTVSIIGLVLSIVIGIYTISNLNQVKGTVREEQIANCTIYTDEGMIRGKDAVKMVMEKDNCSEIDAIAKIRNY